MLIRTVLDCRPAIHKFHCNLLLLVASWAQRVDTDIPLSVVITGEPPNAMLAFLDAHGVDWFQADPDPGLAFVPTGNTLLGGQQHQDQDRILLVDNDVYFLDGLTSLVDIDVETFAGVPSGHQRITPTQWDIIEAELGRLPVLRDWTARGIELTNLLRGGKQKAMKGRAYVNGGVLLLPRDPGFVARWRSDIISIADRFRGTDLETRGVCRSNMVGLATTAGSHGRFLWLEERYNYRHLHILLNLARFEDISIIHMTGDARQDDPIRDAHHISDYIHAYWENRVLARVKDHSHVFAPDVKSDIENVIRQLTHAMLDSVKAYDLDRVMADILSERPR